MTEIPEADKFVGAILFAEAVMTFETLVQKTGTGLERLKSGTGIDTPLPPDKLGEHVIVTYQRLRKGMGFIALCFPLIILAVGWWLLLFALGVFLILYKGFNWWEDKLLMIAGWAAICVATFPMWYDNMYYDEKHPAPDFTYEAMCRLLSWLHYISAIVLFICMALLALLCSKTTLNDEGLIPALSIKEKATWADHYPKWSSFFIAWLPLFAMPILYFWKSLPTQRDTFVRNYNWIGLAMVLFPATALVVTYLTQLSKYFVLFLEMFGIWTFAAFWLLKSHELMLSQPEKMAIKHMNPLPGGPGISDLNRQDASGVNC